MEVSDNQIINHTNNEISYGNLNSIENDTYLNNDEQEISIISKSNVIDCQKAYLINDEKEISIIEKSNIDAEKEYLITDNGQLSDSVLSEELKTCMQDVISLNQSGIAYLPAYYLESDGQSNYISITEAEASNIIPVQYCDPDDDSSPRDPLDPACMFDQTSVIEQSMNDILEYDHSDLMLHSGQVSPPQLPSSPKHHTDIGIKFAKPKKKGGWPKGRRRKKVYLGPKAPNTAYVIYNYHRRKDIRIEQPDLSFSQQTRLLGNEWSNLSTHEKQPYVDLSKKDKLRYVEQLKTYQMSAEYQQYLRDKKSKRTDADLPSMDIDNFVQDMDSLENGNDLYCAICNQYFSSMHNRREHMFGKQHITNVTIDFENNKAGSTDNGGGGASSKASPPTPLQHHSTSDDSTDISVLDPDHSHSDKMNKLIAEFNSTNKEVDKELEYLKQLHHKSRIKHKNLEKKVKNLKKNKEKAEEKLRDKKECYASIQAAIDALKSTPSPIVYIV